MRNFIKYFPIVILISIGLAARSDEYSDDLTKWVATEPPLERDERWLAANNDVDHEWTVLLREGSAFVRQIGAQGGRDKASGRGRDTCRSMPFEVKRGTAAEGLAGDLFCTEVFDGWLAAFNAGEFGAWLWWFSPDGTKKYKISNNHVIGFVRTEIGLVAIEGIAHGTTSRGSLLNLSNNADGVWVARSVMDIGRAPEAFFKESSSSMVIASSDQLIRVHVGIKKLDILLEKTFWRGLYPNSVVATSSHTIYVGMRYGVARIELKNEAYNILWLTPK